MTARRDAPQRIRRALASAEAGLSVRELATAAGLHENAVRRTLAALVGEGAVAVERRPPAARGRPLLLYRLVGAADEPFRALLPLLLDLLPAGERSAGAAYAAGLAHGESAPGLAARTPRQAVVASLATLGFAPVEQPAGASPRVTLDLTRCPFAAAVTSSANGRTICHLHHGLLAGVARAAGGELEAFAINDPRVVPCRVTLRDQVAGAPAR